MSPSLGNALGDLESPQLLLDLDMLDANLRPDADRLP